MKNINEEKQLGKADLHVHSKYSYDGFSSVEDILRKAQERDLDLIAITDHDTIEGAIKAQRIAKKYGVEVIVGEEIGAKEGEIIALFIKEAVASNQKAEDTIKEIHKQGGLAIIPHPANWSLGGVPFKIIFKIFKDIDGIELFNASWAGKIRRKKAKKLNDDVYHLAKTAGSDAHFPGQIGRAYTIFLGQTSSDLYESIKERRTDLGGRSWTWFDHLFWLINFPIRRLLKIIKSIKKK